MKALVRTGAVLLAVALCVVPAPRSSAQDGALAPQIPSYRRSLDLFARERLTPVVDGRPLRLVRYGKAGDLEEPGVLDLPFEGRSIDVGAYDWLVAGDRPVELRRLPGYEGWVELAPGAHLLVSNEDRAELVYGSSFFSGDESYRSSMHVGSIAIQGDGRSLVRRAAANVLIRVESGRFEIFRGGALVASLGAGQEREFLLDEQDRADPADATERYTAMIDGMEEALFSRWSSGALMLEGAVLIPIWERTLAVLPLYARASVERAQWIDYPDIWERRIGEALRILAAYSFVPETGT